MCKSSLSQILWQKLPWGRGIYRQTTMCYSLHRRLWSSLAFLDWLYLCAVHADWFWPFLHSCPESDVWKLESWDIGTVSVGSRNVWEIYGTVEPEVAQWPKRLAFHACHNWNWFYVKTWPTFSFSILAPQMPQLWSPDNPHEANQRLCQSRGFRSEIVLFPTLADLSKGSLNIEQRSWITELRATTSEFPNVQTLAWHQGRIQDLNVKCPETLLVEF